MRRFGSVIAVAELSLEVRGGRIFGLIGPDGAGKTTAMRIACNLLRPDSGRVSVCGLDPTRDSLGVKERIGYMPQRFSLYPDLTVAENIRFFADLYLVSDAERREREERLMQFSRLAPFRNRRAGQLSGGMKQKLALSCALIHTPEVLILDEPTAGVDPVSRREFWSLLKELAAGGIALLVSTAYMDEAALCDRIALMHRGKVIAMGTPQQVTEKFQENLFIVAGNDVAAARTRLTKISGCRVLRFGDSLHIASDMPELESEARRVLEGLAVDLRPIPPTIEDVFMALM